MGTHKILVNGTAFAVTAGTELINGTICKTGGGSDPCQRDGVWNQIRAEHLYISHQRE